VTGLVCPDCTSVPQPIKLIDATHAAFGDRGGERSRDAEALAEQIVVAGAYVREERLANERVERTIGEGRRE